MIRMKQVMAIARAETRVTRRLARYWVFMILASLLALISYFQYSIYHGLFSTQSATIALLSPRLLVSVYGSSYLIIFALGAIFLGFDVRARDQRERMIEVLDSRPYTNLELVAGRYLGILIPAWVPMLILALFMQVLGLLLLKLGAPLGEPIEAISLFSYVVLMGIPAVSFSLALVFLVTLLVRNRLVSAVLLLIILGSAYAAIVFLPIFQGRVFDFFGILYIGLPSDILPNIMLDGIGLIQRLSVLIVAFGLLGISAVVHPRLDGNSRFKPALTSLLVIVLGFAIMGFCADRYSDDRMRMPAIWKEAHAARADDPIPDTQSISGDIMIVPGKVLDLDIDLNFRAPEQESLESALFTLNPGQKVIKALDASGQSLDFTHENGLLEFILPRPLGPGEEMQIRLSIKGAPDPRFGYLESAYLYDAMKNIKASNMPLLGFERSIFDARFVALMPGSRWLPVSGPETNRDDPRKRRMDFFNVELFVDIPDDWLVAGPGRRHHVDGENQSAKFRFAPSAPVPEVALVASDFESRSMEIEGVLMELLVHKKHTKNLEVLAETHELVQNWIRARFLEAKERGLSYPYDGLTLVEVPFSMRAYAGGWRLDTAMMHPGVMLMRENGFPIARFDSAFRKPEDFKDREGGIAQAKFERLKTFFLNDFSGGNIFAGAGRNFFTYQTYATGPEGLALNYVMETLATLSVTETRGYFSAHLFATGGIGISRFLASTILTYLSLRSFGATIADTIIYLTTTRPEVWDQALKIPLNDMDPWEDPARTVDVLTLKALGIAQVIQDTLGHETTGQLLSTIRNDHKGGSFVLADVIKAGNALGYDLDELLGDMLSSTALSGFVCSEAKVYRIPDSEDGSPRYQLLFTVRNDEPVPGVFRLIYFFPAGEGQIDERVTRELIRMKGKSVVRFGEVLSRVPTGVFINPYLSLNRTTFQIETNSLDHNRIEKVDAVQGVSEIPWALSDDGSLIVDDLDPGFSVVEDVQTEGMRLATRQRSTEAMDQGLPVRGGTTPPWRWSRDVNGATWGKYRHTMAIIRGGNGDKKAVFTAGIPKAGSWELELYVPQGIFSARALGTWNLAIVDSNGDRHEIKFDSKSAPGGWNMVESLDLPEGETQVIFSNMTNGRFVVADAIRWSPSAGD